MSGTLLHPSEMVILKLVSSFTNTGELCYQFLRSFILLIPSHGLSTRLTGGPANSGCLGFGEAGGMGEGWGDGLATLIRQIEEHKNFRYVSIDS